MSKIPLYIAFFVLFAGAALADEAVGSTLEGPNPQSTQTYTEDRNTLDKLPPDNSHIKSDEDIVAALQKSIKADTTLSPQARNVKIVSAKGKVTLNGYVSSKVESEAIEVKAGYIAGNGNVTNRLMVRPSSL